jgi:hypothetical protein
MHARFAFIPLSAASFKAQELAERNQQHQTECEDVFATNSLQAPTATPNRRTSTFGARKQTSVSGAQTVTPVCVQADLSSRHL